MDINDYLNMVTKIAVATVAKHQIRDEVLEWEKNTKFEVGFYQNLRKHGIYVHRRCEWY